MSTPAAVPWALSFDARADVDSAGEEQFLTQLKAAGVADLVVFMHKGKVWEAGPTAELFAPIPMPAAPAVDATATQGQPSALSKSSQRPNNRNSSAAMPCRKRSGSRRCRSRPTAIATPSANTMPTVAPIHTPAQL